MARNLAKLSLACALFSSVLVWLLLEPELRPYPALAVLAGLLFLLAPLLSLGALVLGRQARRQASKEAGIPVRTGFALALIGLGVWVVVLILLLPLLAGSGRGPARDRASLWNLQTGLEELVSAYDEASAAGLAEEPRLEFLEQRLADMKALRNPWNRDGPAWASHIFISGSGEATTEALARQRATVVGQVVFVLSAPAKDSGPRWLAGCVRFRTVGSRSSAVADAPNVMVKTTPLKP